MVVAWSEGSSFSDCKLGTVCSMQLQWADPCLSLADKQERHHVCLVDFGATCTPGAANTAWGLIMLSILHAVGHLRLL
jgi:hypothetical protein